MMYGDSIMFSIKPISVGGITIFDGGEIWVWDGSPAGPAQFLVHGGHVWDTAFDVMGTFDVTFENINALEAVSEPPIPEPTSILLLGLGLTGLVGFIRKKKS